MLRVPLVVLALAVLAAAAAPLARAEGGSVTIAPPGGGAPRTLSLASLPFDVHDVSYTLRRADGTTSRVKVADGISLGALLQAAGLDGDPYAYVEIPRPDGSGSAYVLRDNLAGGGDGPPVVWSDAQGVHLLRPSDGRGDANAEDDLTFADGTLPLELHGGKLLVPQVSVTPPQGRPHETLVFSASLGDGVALPAGMRFQWYFDGGTYVQGALVRHRFSAAGTYKVQLNVVRGDVNQTSYPTLVFVRIASAAPKPAAGGGVAQGTVIAGGGTGSAGGAGTGGTAAPVRPTPPTAATAPRRPALSAPRPPRGQLVSGTLIASASAAPPLAGGAAPTGARASTATADRPLHVPIGAWVAIGLVALLGLGWALESRHTLPFWQP